MYEELQKQLDASVTAYNALKSDFNTLAIQSKAKGEETLKNARGAGRKAFLSKEAQEEVRDMHRLGMSYRAIAKKMGVSFLWLQEHVRGKKKGIEYCTQTGSRQRTVYPFIFCTLK